jgi:hypothetical protein
MMLRLAAVFVLLGGLPALAQDERAAFEIGADSFLAGQSVSHDQPGRDDLFMAGERARAAAAITGSAMVAGRWVALDGAIGADAFAVGQEVSLDADVAGDASLAGQDIDIDSQIGGDLRVTGSVVDLSGTVAGYAIVAAEELSFDMVVAGDMALAARSADFDGDARVGGQLFVYEQELGALEIPASVAPPERIERRQIEEWDDDFGSYRVVSWRDAIGSFLGGVIVVAALAALIAAFLPEVMAEMRRRLLDRPVRSALMGFLTLSMLAGSGLILAMTVIGILLTPAAILLTLLAGFAGYVVGAYAFGVAVLSATGRHDPASTGDRALAAAVGALAAGLIGLVPFLGWLFVLALVLAGLGVITVRLFQPAFFTHS